MIIKNFSNSSLAAQKLGQDLSRKLASLKKIKSLLLLSGGSASKALRYIDGNALGRKLTIGVLDERYDPTNQNSNFWQLAQTNFYQKAKKAGCQLIDTSVKEKQTQKELAEFFEKSLRRWKTKNPEGIIIATIGMGPDGHIAGIMPGLRNFNKVFRSQQWIAAYDAGNKNPIPLRVTATITFLKLIDLAFAFICGKGKAAAFKKIGRSKTMASLPAQVLQKIKKATIYTDIK